MPDKLCVGEVDIFMQNEVYPLLTEEVKIHIQKSYEAFKVRQEPDCLAETEKQIHRYKERVESFFKKLKVSIKEDSSWVFNEVLTKYDYRDTVSVKTMILGLIQSETFLNQQDLMLTYQLGRIFMELKIVKKSIPKMIKSYQLNVSRQYIQEKISLYFLMFDYPRLQQCKVSTSFLIKHRKMFLEEVRYWEDSDFWRSR